MSSSQKEVDKLIELYLNQPNILYEHLFASYHQFIDEIIPYSLIEEQNIFYENIDKEIIYIHGYKCSNIRIKPPTFDNDNEIKFPSDARKNQLNYFASIVVKVQQVVEKINSITGEKTIIHVGDPEDTPIGNIPVMVRSKYCSTSIKKDLKGECKYDPGGYFIVNGAEKIVMSIEKMVDNKVLVFTKKDPSYETGLVYTAQINSRKNDWSDNLQILTIKNKKNGMFTISTSSQLVDIPLFILMRALGIETDELIVKFITYNLEDNQMLNLLRPSIINSVDDENNSILTKEDAIEYLITKLKRNKRISETDNELGRIQKKMYLNKILKHDLLPHLGEDLTKKIVFIGYMVNKLLNVMLGRQDVDDRDALQNKRVEPPGILLGQLFRQNWKKMLNEIGKHFKKKNQSNESPINVVNQIKPSIIEQGLKTALATGIWGMNKTKKGVAQALQRLSWIQSVSYLRRILSPSMDESTQKVTSIRQVSNNQTHLLCPIETPEGAKIGIVKSLAMLASITIQNTSQYYILETILNSNENIKHPYEVDPLEFNYWVKIFINGDLIGQCKIDIAFDIYNDLKLKRRENIIDKHTSILFDYTNKEIRCYCDGGRLIRPLLIVNNNKIGLNPDIINDINNEIKLNNISKSWKMILNKYPYLIEYEDIESLNYLLIADGIYRLEESLDALNRKIDYTNITKVNRYGDFRFLRYTHCEFHSWTMLGSVVSNIPFSNHSYSNRNTLFFSQGKQSIGIYLTSYKDRIDISQILYHPQIPLVTTQGMKYNGCLDLPYGENAIVAIASYTGFNQEDSIIFNQSAIDRGIFRADTLKKYHSEIQKNPSTSQDDVFTKPDRNKVTGMKQGNYDKLNDKGIVPEETIINNDDVIIGKISPIQPTGTNNKVYKDNSEIFKTNVLGVIDRVHTGIYNNEGYEMYNVRVRMERKPMPGDKFTCYDDTHQVLTTDGWINISNITKKHKVASLINNNLVYQHPYDIQSYDYNGDMYLVNSKNVSLCVTPNHRMLVKKEYDENYSIELAEDILHQTRYYKKNVSNVMVETNYKYFNYDNNGNITHFKFDDIQLEITNWIKLFANIICKHSNHNILYIFENMIIELFGSMYNIKDDMCNIFNKINILLNSYEKLFPDWVWYLDTKLSKLLVDSITTKSYITNIESESDDFQRLCIHAGYGTNKTEFHNYENEKTLYTITIFKNNNNSIINKNYIKINNRYVGICDRMVSFNGKVYCCSVEGDGIIMVRRNGIATWCGNSRHGQKGTIGIIYPQKDMPFTESGIIPDLIFNPHGFPKRMSLAQFIETMASKEAAESGYFVDGTPFNNYDIKQLPQVLKKLGFSPYGTEKMYCGFTGRPMDAEIFIGPLYMLRLKHMVLDKVHGRARGPRQALTRQPLEGRARDGGLKIGEMEKDAIVAHGMAQFLKERTMETSDITKLHVCDICGRFATKVIDKEYYKCDGCHNTTRISAVVIPYALKLLFQELASVNILPRIRTEQNDFDEA
jgi:DNA-directed RNA polymerase II subunit RPB2